MPAHVKRAGAWREFDALHVKAGGAWREVDALWVKRGGVWREVFTGVFQFAQTIALDTNQYNLSTELTNAGWDGSSAVIATITVAPSVTVYSTSTAVPAWDMGGALPAESSITLVNNGAIYGMGGAGGKGSDAPNTAIAPNFRNEAAHGEDGEAGGDAVRVMSTIGVMNYGTLGGGGGGGGGGVGVTTGLPSPPSTHFREGGGGGGGGACGHSIPGGTGGAGGAAASPGAVSPGSPGTQPTGSTGGAGGAGGVTLQANISPGAGGAGGDVGQAGNSGGDSTGFMLSGTDYSPGSGGAAGNYLTGNAFVAWLVSGTRLGGVT